MLYQDRSRVVKLLLNLENKQIMPNHAKQCGDLTQHIYSLYIGSLCNIAFPNACNRYITITNRCNIVYFTINKFNVYTFSQYIMAGIKKTWTFSYLWLISKTEVQSMYETIFSDYFIFLVSYFLHMLLAVIISIQYLQSNICDNILIRLDEIKVIFS